MELKLFNTLTRSVEPLRPMAAPKVGIYCCGPTVYNYQHIGNLRTYIFEDLLVRTLRYAGYEVKHVMNITDVGHLVSDADEGEDKMALASRREGKSSKNIAEYYTKIFFDHCDLLNIKRPDVVCKATEHIAQMISLIGRLIERNYAYQAGGNVYFDVAKLPDYGKLARLDLENLKAGARIEVDKNKKHPLDFALWFTKSKFENQELQWDSPWGRGYPGWHIECSAMSIHYLGEEFDIHCGGIDHIPVHHTNEIAQSEGATGKEFVKVWMHGGFLLSDKDKMSKSTGEFLTLDRLVERKIDPMSYRVLCLSAHYRRELSWSWEALDGAAQTLSKLRTAVGNWRKESAGETSVDESSNEGNEIREEFEDAISADLNMPRAIAAFHRIVASPSLSAAEKLSLVSRFDTVLGLGADTWQATELQIPSAVSELVQKREQARASKNWKESDSLRDQILALGFVVEDKREGPAVRQK